MATSKKRGTTKKSSRKPAAIKSTSGAVVPPAPETPPVNSGTFSTAEVRVGRLPGRIDNIVLNGSRKVSDALQGAGLSAEGYEIRVNSRVSKLDTTLVQGDTVLLVKKIQGN